MDMVLASRRWTAGRPEAPGPARCSGPAPRSGMFFPLVVLAAVLPGLYALNWWNLTPPGPWWGLRGLAVLDGWVVDQSPAAETLRPAMEARAFRAVALQPPLYAWLEAVGLALGSDRAPSATVLPSYVAGGLIVLLMYWHGQLWRGSGVGLVAAVLTAFNPHLLIQMKEASPATLALAATLAALYCYGRHFRVGVGTARFDLRGGGASWVVLGGAGAGPGAAVDGRGRPALHPGGRAPPGLSPLGDGPGRAAGTPLVRLVEQPEPAGRRRSPWRSAWLIAAPWYAAMFAGHGREFLGALLNPPDPLGWERPTPAGPAQRPGPGDAPAGALRGRPGRSRRPWSRSATTGRPSAGSSGSIWLAVAALAPATWVGGPQTAMGLFLLVPLNLLAAQAISDLAGRRVSVRWLSWLAPATAVSVAWWLSGDLRGAVIGLTHGHVGPRSALGLHLAVDLLIAVVWLARGLDRWARRRDLRQRRVLASFLLVVLVTSLADGLREVTFRHLETRELMNLRAAVLLRHRARPFRAIAVVGPDLDHPLDRRARRPAAGSGSSSGRPCPASPRST